MQLTKENIQALLLRKDDVGMHACGRALCVLLRNQTLDEKRDADTKHRNDRGFTPSDARRGTSMAQFYMRNGWLTPAQMSYWQDPAWTEARRIRITKYWGQLLEAAEEKQKERQLQLAA
jgi:hypothetical protein